MRFRVSEIRDAGRIEKTEQVEPAQLFGDLPRYMAFPSVLNVSADAQFADTEIVVSGSVEGTALLSCGRCLESFSRPFDLEFDQVYPVDQPEIDLSSEIRDTVMTDMPMAAVCRESCKGICPSCGVNRNQTPCQCEAKKSDSRWSALKTFPFKK